MAIEYEAKILDIALPDIDLKIIAAGGRLVTGPLARPKLMRRYVYDITPGDQSRWIRLRDDGFNITLAVKVIHHDGIDGTEEHEIEVDSFEETHELLRILGFTEKAYQENQRLSYELHGAQLEVDAWPLIPKYLEIEAGSKEAVILAAQRLGYCEAELTSINTVQVYAHYGIDLGSISELRFP